MFSYVCAHMHSWEKTLQISQSVFFVQNLALWIILRSNWLRSLKSFASLMIKWTYLTAPCKSYICSTFKTWLHASFELVHTARPLKNYVLCSMNVCCINVIQTYYICHVPSTSPFPFYEYCEFGHLFSQTVTPHIWMLPIHILRPCIPCHYAVLRLTFLKARLYCV